MSINLHARAVLLACFACIANGHRGQPFEEEQEDFFTEHRYQRHVDDVMPRQGSLLSPLKTLAIFLGVLEDSSAAWLVPRPYLPLENAVQPGAALPREAVRVAVQPGRPLQGPRYKVANAYLFPPEGHADFTLPTTNLLSAETLSPSDVASKTPEDLLAEASAVLKAATAESQTVLNRAKSESQAIVTAAEQQRSSIISKAEAEAKGITDSADKAMADATTLMRQARTNWNRIEGKVSAIRRRERDVEQQRRDLDMIWIFDRAKLMDEKNRIKEEEKLYTFERTTAEYAYYDAVEQFGKVKESVKGKPEKAKQVLADATVKADRILADAKQRSEKVLKDGEQASREAFKAGEAKAVNLKKLAESQFAPAT